jgi:hypothetical protein
MLCRKCGKTLYFSNISWVAEYCMYCFEWEQINGITKSINEGRFTTIYRDLYEI